MWKDEFRVGAKVAVRDEYIGHPSLKGHTQGTIAQTMRIGTVMVYTLALTEDISTNITHGALILTE